MNSIKILGPYRNYPTDYEDGHSSEIGRVSIDNKIKYTHMVYKSMVNNHYFSSWLGAYHLNPKEAKQELDAKLIAKGYVLIDDEEEWEKLKILI